MPADALKAPKSRLQERAFARTGRAPAYRIVSCEGPDHDRHFVVEVIHGRPSPGAGGGPQPPRGGDEAAEVALAALDADLGLAAATAADPRPA